MEMSFLTFLLLSLASFRLTHLFVYDKITLPLRLLFLDVIEEGGEEYYVPKDGIIKRFIGEVITCHWCTSVWAAMILTGGYVVLPSFFFILIVILAVAGVAALIEAITAKFFLD
ncbi:DUF1360 domain-containing protein [Alteribacter aurantiacus]|uniref:DUF1360 domain-containing protein n=1 Tax=Alteribacter aurantiacus TaxID=254410 RepID=UPI0004163B50|nr:DUF1360 domain-containing protein [Alteribacter aurantiacus]